MSPPTLIVHADWSVRPDRRWMCVAESTDGEHYTVSAPEPVGSTTSLLARLTTRARAKDDEPCVLIGVDVPIGLPSAYATRAGIDSFLRALPRFGHGPWADFYHVAEQPDEISACRPFYPKSPGAARQKHLLDALHVHDMNALLRRVERATEHRAAAASLFWTMGARQVGKAAIAVWRDVLAPALSTAARDLAVWPFDGRLHELLRRHQMTIAEVYPAEACVQLGLGSPGRRWSKRSREDRVAHAGALHQWAQSRGVRTTPALVAAIRDGFGDRPDGEDRFDSVVALFSMIDVVEGRRSEGAPDCPDIASVEGWILGQTP